MILMCIEIKKYFSNDADYIVIDPQKTSLILNKETIQKICDRKNGIGSDAIIYGPLFIDDKLTLEIYNADGTPAEETSDAEQILQKYLNEHYSDEQIKYCGTISLSTNFEKQLLQ